MESGNGGRGGGWGWIGGVQRLEWMGIGGLQRFGVCRKSGCAETGHVQEWGGAEHRTGGARLQGKMHAVRFHTPCTPAYTCFCH